MLKRMMKRNWWLIIAIAVLLIVRLFEPFKSNFLLTMLAALTIGAVAVVLMAIIPKSSH